MASVLDAFKIKPYDLDPVLAQWTNGLVFNGTQKDLPVDEWLEQIKAGCVERKIPEECWHKVAQHFMGPDAKARLKELKEVIAKVHGGKYRWSWKKFKLAMENMGWEIETSKTETIKVSKQSGSWWRLRKREETKKEPVPEVDQTPRRPLRQQSSFWSLKRKGSGIKDDELLPPVPLLPPSVEPVKKTDATETGPTRRPPTRSNTIDIWPMRKTEEPEEISTNPPQPPPKSKSELGVVSRSQSPSRRDMESGTATVTQAPVWLLNACTALEYITSEHPKAMSIISAILITAGSIPALPAISAGAGGPILASHAVQAIGAIAVGIGQVISSTTKMQQESQKQVEGSTLVH